MREITLTGDLRLYASDKPEQYITPDADRVVTLPPENGVAWSITVRHAGLSYVLTVQRASGAVVEMLVSGSRPTYAWNGTTFSATAGALPGSIAAAAVAGAPKGAIWQRKGRQIYDPTWLEALQECNVIFEAPSHLLGLPPEEPVFKMWHSGGNTGTVVGSGGSGGMYYAESRNGTENWVRHPTAVVAPASRSSVVKHNGTYYIYSMPYGQRFPSADGITFGAAQQLYMTGTAGTWEAGGMQNSCTWIEDGVWKMMYEGSADTGNIWQVGLATSLDGITWARNPSNPVMSAGDGLNSVSAPDIHKIGDWYYGWFHAATTNAHLSSTTVPTDIYRARSRDLITWERTPRHPVFSRATIDEGVGSPQGQNADVMLVEVAGRVHMYYEGGDGAILSQRNFSIKCAVANCTFEQLVQTNEGDSTGDVPAIDKMGGTHIPTSLSIGPIAGEYYEALHVETIPGNTRGVNFHHRGNLTALTVSSEWPCACNLEIGEGANYKLPLKLNAGPVLSTPIPGGIEFDGTNLYFTTAAGVRKTITAT